VVQVHCEGGALRERYPVVTLHLVERAQRVVQVHCEDRAVREEVYRAFITRASSGEADNTDVITEILKLRKERAGILGYAHHADVSMASKVRLRSAFCRLTRACTCIVSPAHDADASTSSKARVLCMPIHLRLERRVWLPTVCALRLSVVVQSTGAGTR
jgi:Peptidase family M3